MLFLGLSYVYKVSSIWNENKPKYRMYGTNKVIVDLWSQRKNADYLHYMKFEFMQLTFAGSYFLNCFIMATNLRIFFDDSNVNNIAPDVEKSITFMSCANGLTLLLFVIQIWNGKRIMKGVESTQRIEKAIKIGSLVLVVLILVFYLVSIVHYSASFPEWKKLVVRPRRIIWIEIEIASLGAFVVYFFIARFYFLQNTKAKANMLKKKLDGLFKVDFEEDEETGSTLINTVSRSNQRHLNPSIQEADKLDDIEEDLLHS